MSDETNLTSLRLRLAANPDDDECRSDLGRALLGMGRHEETIECLQAIDEPHACVHSWIGIALYRQGQTERASSHLMKALWMEPRRPEHWHNLAMLEADPEPSDSAINNLRMAISLDSTFQPSRHSLAGALRIRAHSQRNRGEFSEAVNTYREALRLEPARARTRASLAWCLVRWGIASPPCERLNHFREAVHVLRVHLAWEPDDAPAVALLALVLSHLRKRREALEAASRAVQLLPEDGTCLAVYKTCKRAAATGSAHPHSWRRKEGGEAAV